MGLIGIVSLWSPMLNPVFEQRWFGWPGILLTSPVPIAMLALAWGFWRGISLKHHVTPLLCALGWFLMCFIGLAISIFPDMVPPSISIQAAAAPAESQAFLLVGAVVLIPMILLYNIYAYYVFRGKVQVGAHYH